MMAGPDFLYKDADGHFSLTKWKARIDRYDDVTFDAYIKDGTLIGHYLIDEPNDPANGMAARLGHHAREMARYSKAKWPGLPTIVRTYPDYLEKWAPYRSSMPPGRNTSSARATPTPSSRSQCGIRQAGRALAS